MKLCTESRLACWLPALMLAASLAMAEPGTATPLDSRPARVELADQEAVVGELTRLPDGRYRVVSETQGELIIEDGKVKSITYLDLPATTDAAPVDQAVLMDQAVDTMTVQVARSGVLDRLAPDVAGLHSELDRLNARVESGEATPEELARLKAYAESGNPTDLGVPGFEWLDPAMLEALNDPEIQKALAERNFLQLMTNEKMHNLADGSTAMRRLVDQVLGRPPRDPEPAAAEPAEAAPAEAVPAEAVPAADEPAAAE